jgi:phosphoribosylglycinamide formyltransferase 1
LPPVDCHLEGATEVRAPKAAHHGSPGIATIPADVEIAAPTCSARFQAVRRLGVLASGSGTILQALLDDRLPVEVVVVDRQCGAVERAERAGVPVEVVERESFGDDFDRVAYTHRVVDALKRHEVDLVAMAGFGTILSQEMHDAYPRKILNTHPALLPSFKGWHGVRDALAAGVKVTGCTVHLATLEVDEGPILAQEAVAVLPDDTEETLHERIKDVERRIYPRVIREQLEEAS